MAGARFPAEPSDFSVLHRIQSDSEALLAFYFMGTGGDFPGRGVKLISHTI
jgi:hypothetical protein